MNVSLCCLIVVLTLFIGSSEGILEKDVGLYDLHETHVGAVKDSCFVMTGSSKRVVLISENVLASLSLKHGEIKWRKMLDDKALFKVVCTDKLVFVLGAGYVSAFDISGSFIWDKSFDNVVDGYYVEDKQSIVILENDQYHIVSEKGLITYSSNYDLESKDDLVNQYTVNAEFSVQKEGNKLSVLSEDQTELISVNTVASQLDATFSLYHTKGASGKNVFFILGVYEDMSIRLFSADGEQWNRDESLSLISDALIIDLPERVDEDTLHFISRLYSQLSIVTRLMNNIQHEITSLITRISGNDEIIEKKNTLVSDVFGYRRLILGITDNSKLFAIHSETGDTLWSSWYSTDKLNSIFFFHKQFYGYLLGSTESNNWIETFNPLTGNVIERTQLPYQIFHKTTLHIDNDEMIVLMDYDGIVHVFPETEHNTQLCKDNIENLYFYSLEKDSKSLVGYAVTLDKKGDLVYRVRWTKQFTADEEISAFHHIRTNSYLPATITGDISVLWKYLNPNTLVLITETAKQVDGAPSLKHSDYSINVYLFDIVSGNLIHSINQKYAAAPVSVTGSDNWFTFTYFNTKSHMFELSSVEIFTNSSAKTEFSSFEPHKLNILSKTYVFPNRITEMAVTSTNLGISRKKIIMALENGQIVSLDKRFIDTRRPILPSMEATMEGLFQYMPNIPIIQRDILNYYNKISKVRNIVVSPAKLESTSHVFVYGLDYFFTPTTSGKPYDRLEITFPGEIMWLCCILVASISFFLSSLLKRKQVSQNWL